MRKKTVENYTISHDSVDEISEKVREFFDENNAGFDLNYRVRLCLEESLLILIEEFGEGFDAVMTFSKKMGRPYVSIRYKGKEYNPLNSEKNDRVSEAILTRLEVKPAYSYNSGVNKVTFFLPSAGVRREVWMLVAVIVALLIGLCGDFIPVGIREGIETYVLDPISGTFMKLLSMVAPIVIFLYVLNAIINNPSGDTFGRIGKYVISRFVFLSVVFGGFFTVIISFFYTFNHGETGGFGGEIKKLLDMLLDVIPGNVVQPFLDGNTMQLVLLALALGIIIVGLDNRVNALKNAMIDLKDVFSSALELVCRILPIYIFVSLVGIIWEYGTDSFTSFWKPICVYVGLGVVFLGGYMMYNSIKLKVSVFLLIKKIFPTFFMGLITASSMTTISKAGEINKNKLGMEPGYADFAYPMAITLYEAFFMPTFLISSYYLAEVYGVPVSPIWFLKAGIVTLILAYSAPQVSGGALICLTVLLEHLQIPMEGLPIAGILVMFIDFFATAFKIASGHMEMLRQADHLGLLDKEVLRQR